MQDGRVNTRPKEDHSAKTTTDARQCQLTTFEIYATATAGIDNLALVADAEFFPPAQ